MISRSHNGLNGPLAAGMMAMLAAMLACENPIAGHMRDTDAKRHLESLVLVEPALNVKWFDQPDAAVTYTADVKYPAPEVIAEILERITEAGWREVREDSSEPFLDEVHSLGWVFYVDSTKHPEQGVYQWTREWENADADRVFCALRYNAAGTELLSEAVPPLKVAARYLRAATLKELQPTPPG